MPLSDLAKCLWNEAHICCNYPFPDLHTPTHIQIFPPHLVLGTLCLVLHLGSMLPQGIDLLSLILHHLPAAVDNMRGNMWNMPDEL